jgi:hypothetical protein
MSTSRMCASTRTGSDQRRRIPHTWNTASPPVWVIVDGHGAVQTDAAMHERCLRLASAACPHLLAEAASLRAVEVRRCEIHGDGRPLRDGGAVERERWTVPTAGRGVIDHGSAQ